jgi:hypothetical protein
MLSCESILARLLSCCLNYSFLCEIPLVLDKQTVVICFGDFHENEPRDYPFKENNWHNLNF